MSSYLRSYKYDDLSKYIWTGKSRIERKIENNTYARYDNWQLDLSPIIIKFHFTDIATIYDDNKIVLNSGGYQTYTTKDRLNKIIDHLPFRIYQDKGIWYLWDYQNKSKWTFKDGLTIHADLSISGYAENYQEQAKLRKSINKYVASYMKALINGKVDAPGNGDCFYCLMRNKADNKPLGESTQSNDHIQEHIKENYFVPSLLTRSIELFPISNLAKSVLYDLWVTKDHLDFTFGLELLQEQGNKSLRKYIYSQFNLPY